MARLLPGTFNSAAALDLTSRPSMIVPTGHDRVGANTVPLARNTRLHVHPGRNDPALVAYATRHAGVQWRWLAREGTSDSNRMRSLAQAQSRRDQDGTERTTATTETDAEAAPAGAVIGPYHLLQPAGEGGMGEVWIAEQANPFDGGWR